MTGWSKLPPELRWLILEHVLMSHDWESDLHARARYASVCREWQYVFEFVTFQLLVLDQDRLQDFKRVVCRHPRRRNLVRTIVLRIKLRDYDCTVCESVEDDFTIKRNDEVFVKTLRAFLDMMSKWEPNKQGITLDLGAYSPSDGQHSFRDYRLSSDYQYLPLSGFKSHLEKYRDHALIVEALEDSCPGWINASKGNPSPGARKRTFSILADPYSLYYKDLFKPRGKKRQRRLPKAPAITGLLMRRHYTRPIAPEMLSRLFRESLVGLQKFHHEMWLKMDVNEQIGSTLDYCTFIGDKMPNTVKELHLYEEANYRFHPRGFQRNMDRSLMSMELAMAGCRLRTLTASHLVDAKDFFPRIWTAFDDWHNELGQAHYYPELECLALTSQALESKTFNQSVMNLFMNTAVTVLHCMPKLKILEIWDAGDKFAWLFRFTTEGGMKIKWRCSWDMDMNPVFEGWQKMIKEIHKHKTLTVEVSREPGEKLQGCHDFFKRLRLRREIVERLSAWQMKWENESHDE